MIYKKRFLEQKIRASIRDFEAILVTGPKQAGKTVLLTHVGRKLFGDGLGIIAFDTPSEIDRFRRDPDLFFINNPGKLFLDEIQHIPDIFPYLSKSGN